MRMNAFQESEWAEEVDCWERDIGTFWVVNVGASFLTVS